MPGHRTLVKVHLETLYIYVIFKRVFINNKLPIRVVYVTGTQKGTCFFGYCSSILIKKLTVASGRSPSTRKRMFLNLLQFYIFQRYTHFKKVTF